MNLKFPLPFAPSPMIREFFPASLVRMVLAAVFFLLVGAWFCFADDGTAVVGSSTTVTLTSILSSLDDYVEAITILISCLFAIVGGGRIIVQVIGLLNISDATQKANLEAKMRDVLHDAIENGLKYAFTKAGVPASMTPSPEVISNAIAYVEDKNPQVLAFFNVQAEQLEHIVLAKIPEVLPWLRQFTSSDGTDTEVVPPANAPAAAAPVAPVEAPVAG